MEKTSKAALWIAVSALILCALLSIFHDSFARTVNVDFWTGEMVPSEAAAEEDEISSNYLTASGQTVYFPQRIGTSELNVTVRCRTRALNGVLTAVSMNPDWISVTPSETPVSAQIGDEINILMTVTILDRNYTEEGGSIEIPDEVSIAVTLTEEEDTLMSADFVYRDYGRAPSGGLGEQAGSLITPPACYVKDTPMILMADGPMELSFSSASDTESGCFPAGTRFTFGTEKGYFAEPGKIEVPSDGMLVLDLSKTDVRGTIRISGASSSYEFTEFVDPTEADYNRAVVIEDSGTVCPIPYRFGNSDPSFSAGRWTAREDGTYAIEETDQITCTVSKDGKILLYASSSAPSGTYRIRLSWNYSYPYLTYTVYETERTVFVRHVSGAEGGLQSEN
ncbi:MAG: hypothetical protein IK088_06410 [Lachnospiraceae bacterium]|nr:hypothetical protein [Lachnospiraceae bacterium]